MEIRGLGLLNRDDFVINMIMEKNADCEGGPVRQNMGDGNKESVVFERSASADGCAANMSNPTCSTSSNKLIKKRPDSLKLELLRIHNESVRNSYVYNSNDLSISFRSISYTVKHGVFLNSK